MPSYTWVGTTSDWGTPGNWSPGTSAAGVGPTVGDTVIFNGTSSAACTTGTTARNCLTLTTTGYTGTLTIGGSSVGTLTVTGNVTIGNHTIAGLANLIMTGSATLNVPTTVIIPNFRPDPATSLLQAITLSGDTTITNFSKGGSGNVTFNAASSVSLNITNGSIITSFGSFIMGANVTLTIVGSSSIGAINFNGAMNVSSGATLTHNGSQLNLGTASIATTFNCSLGTFNPGTNTVSFGPTITLNMGSTNSFYNLSSSGATVTMQSNIRVTNNFTLSLINNYNGAFDIIVGGNFSNGRINNTSPSRRIIMNGSNTSSVTITNAIIGNNYTLEIDCLSKPVTFTGLTTLAGATVPQSGGINYLSTNTGTFITTGHILNYANGIINMNGKPSSTHSWNIISNNSGTPQTLTLQSNVFCQTLGDSSFVQGTALNDVFASAGGPYYLGILGNAENIRGTNAASTAEWRFVGSTSTNIDTVNPADIFNIDIRIDKTAGTVTFPAAFVWGGTSRTLNLNSIANFAANSTTLTLAGTPLTILNASNSQFYNLTTAANQTININ
jgi:hypothetical protein